MEQHINLQAHTDRSVCDWNIFQDNDLFYVTGCTVCTGICAHYLSVKQNAPCCWFYCLPIFWSVCNCMLCSTKSVCQWSRFSICTTTSIPFFQLFASNLFRMLYFSMLKHLNEEKIHKLHLVNRYCVFESQWNHQYRRRCFGKILSVLVGFLFYEQSPMLTHL